MRRERSSRPKEASPGRRLRALGAPRRTRSQLSRGGWGLVALALTLHGSPAFAQGAPGQQPGAKAPEGAAEKAPAEVAKVHFEAALEAYREGKYERAVEELEEALRLDPSGKDLVYNLGLVHEKLGNLDKALFYFRRYLEMETDPAERERAEVIVQRLAGAQERALRASSGGEDDPDDPGSGEPGKPRAAEDHATGKLDMWVYGTAGLSLAALALGVIFGVRAVVKHPGGSPSTGPGETASDLQRDAASAHDMALVADISFGVALLSGAAASILYFARTPDEPSRTHAGSHATLEPVPYGINYRGTF